MACASMAVPPSVTDQLSAVEHVGAEAGEICCLLSHLLLLNKGFSLSAADARLLRPLRAIFHAFVHSWLLRCCLILGSVCLPADAASFALSALSCLLKAA